MKKFIKFILPLCAVLVFSSAVNAQSRPANTKDDYGSAATTILKGTGKVGVIVVGSAAKVAWGVTKFTAKHVVKPIAKTLFVRAAPTAGKFVLKKSAKYVLPFVAKLSVL